MKRLSKIVLAVAVGIGCLVASGTAAADWHGHVGVYIGPGPFWWGAPYYYPYYYPPPVVVQPAPAYVQPSYTNMPAAPESWYFCRAANAYYPYVDSCPGGWETVTPRPQGPVAAPAQTPPPQSP
jgi:hypothetical protein